MCDVSKVMSRKDNINQTNCVFNKKYIFAIELADAAIF